MQIFSSFELRWFSPDPFSQVESWFSGYSEKLSGDWDRTDQYLKTDNTSFSIKIREGRLEFKVRGEQGYNPFNNLPGDVYFWNKWSYDLNKGLPTRIIAKPETDIIEVSKERILSYTAIDKKIIVPSLPAGATGCQIEYSRIAIRQSHFYTFGLEAFGTDEKKMVMELEHAAAVLMTEIPNFSMAAEHNADYPEKLAAL